MKKVTYHCNLCQETITKNEIIALYFKCDTIPMRYVLDKSKVDECNKHICKTCLDLIRSCPIMK